MAADDPRDGHSDWHPDPGSTALATEQLRRELSGLREILTARLDGMDRATALLSETVNRTPTVIQTEISHLRELMNEKLGSIGGQAEEKFGSISLQFQERDVRTNQASIAADSALKAALQAAKEAVFEQAQAAAKAAEKTELSFTKQIDQIGLQISTVAKGYDDRIVELKERIDRGEGTTTGHAEYRVDQRLGIGQLLQAAAVVLTMIGLIVVAFHK
jgi:hypothetical protein